MKILSSGLSIVGVIIIAISGLIGLVWELSFILDKFGTIGFIVSILIFPISSVIGAVLLLYICFTADGGWMLPAIVFGGFIIGGIFLALASWAEE
jgi:hypothetical protein